MKTGGKFYNWMKSFDSYGEPIGLKYEGEDTFKTLPGGIMSILLLIIMVFYSLLKFKYMFNKEQWSLVQQTLVLTVEELEVANDLNQDQFSNLSIAL
jgi:hypothetical protein